MDQDPAAGLPRPPRPHDDDDALARHHPGRLSDPEPPLPPPPDAPSVSHPDHQHLPSAFPSFGPPHPATPQLDAPNAPSNHAATPIDPDDFYKSYRIAHDLDDAAAARPMAPSASSPSVSASTSASATRLSLQSNGVDAASSHSRLPALPGLRSASATAGRPHTGPSVKDLKKRFDQNGSASPASRPSPASNAAAHQRPAQAFSPGQLPQNHVGTQMGMRSHSSHSNGGDATPAVNPASSPQSFASRIHSSGGAPAPSPASTGLHRARKIPSQPMSTAAYADDKPQPPPLLFGEIPPQQYDSQFAGHGIEEIRPRRMSESNTVLGTSPELGLEPSSTASSYKSAATHHTHYIQERGPGAATFHQPRTRSQSDASSPASSIRTPMSRKSGRKSSASPPSLSASQSGSRLPVPVRKFNSPSSSESTPPSRANSPSVAARASPGVGGQSRMAAPPRAKTPTSRSKTPTSQSKTPTNNQKERRPPPPSLNNTGSHALPAYGAVPPPQHSPPIRRSRPRQPVSSASTVSSRMRSASRTRSPLGNANKTASRGAERGRRRKISVGPIDFEQRREHIRLAYSKSIRASEALEAKQRASEQETLTREAATAVAEMPPLPAAYAGAAYDVTSKSQEPDAANSPAATLDPSATWAAQPADTLVVSTTHDAFNMPASEDSPTLGVPGSFPQSSPIRNREERPVSMASETTEFDGETQTNPPVPAQPEETVPVAIVKPPSPGLPMPSRQKSQYHYPFSEEPVAGDEPATGGQDNGTKAMDAAHSFHIGGDASTPTFNQGQHPRSHQPHDSTATIQEFSASEHARREQSEDNTAKVPFPRIDTQDDSECQSDVDGIAGASQRQSTYLGSEYATTDACTEETDDRDPYERQSEFRYGEVPESQRASTCASSDVSGTDDLQHYSQNRNLLSASGGLGLPTARYRPDRLSHQSGWTDISVDSSASELAAAAGQHDSRPTSYNRAGLGQLTSSPRQEAFPHRTEARYDSSLNSSFSHQLPELDTGEGFSIHYLSPEPSHSLSYLPSPNHEPPPIPKSVSGSALHSRTSSAFYEHSQSASTLLYSERNSEVYASYAETPQSGDATSLETADHESGLRLESDGKSISQGDDALSKERHRLVQRRNVIKELVDTEAVFVRDMNIVEEIYKGTAEACPRLDDQTVKLIFRNSHEVIEFHTTFLAEIKGAVASVYVPKGGRTAKPAQLPTAVETGQPKSEPSDFEDRDTSIGPVFHRNLEKMKVVHEGFLRNSDQAAKKLIEIQQDSAVKVWLTECNEVAKDLTAAWDLDSLLIKPMQRITKYPTLIMTLLQHTPEDHPDRESLLASKDALETSIIEINKTKKNFELVGQIVGRKRKESDVKAGFARAFGKRVDKLQASGNRPPEDTVYAKLNEKFGDDFVQLQVVLRDVEFYTRQVSQYVHEFLQYLSSIELVMRLQPGSYPEIESKWVQFNISMRDLEKAALEDHLALVRKQVIEPFEQVIKAYGNPSLAMKKRQKRRLDYERAEQLRRGGKSLDSKLRELVEQYDALNDTLKSELPKLSHLTEQVGKICLGNFVNIQASWYKIWKEKMRTVLSDCPEKPELEEVVATFHRDYPYAAEQIASIGILNADNMSRISHSTDARSRYSEVERRGRGSSVYDENAPSLPTPDFGKRGSSGLTMSASSSTAGTAAGSSTNPHHYYYRDFYSGIQTSGASSGSPRSAEMGGSSRSAAGTGPTSTRPSTGKSLDSVGVPRQSSESAHLQRPDSNAAYNSAQPQDNGRFSNLFHSALPLSDGPDESHLSSRASSRERGGDSDCYNVLWLAASLFEFNIETTKHEAGYPYLTYQAGEIFDVIAEKGELWLAKNQDDPSQEVGWIWSKHFAKLADS